MVEVTRIVVPGAIIRTHRKPLSEFGPVPFKIIILRSRLKVSSSKTSDTSSCCTISNKPATASTSQVTLPEPTISPNVIEDANGSIELALIANSADSIPLAALMEEQNQQVHTSEHGRSEYVTDQSCLNEGKDILGVTPTDWPTLVRSRILKDPFHVFNMIYISRSHGLRFDFLNALRDAIFIPDLEDKRRIESWGATLSPPMTFEDFKKSCPKTLWKHCRRIIPPPEILYPLVYQVFHAYGPLRDAQTGRTLFDSNNWKTAKNILELIRLGQLSDPPGISLYTQIGSSEKFGSLPVYCCSRGTNQTEGGVHTQLRIRLPTSGASIRHVNSALMDFVLRHNLLVSC